MNVTLLLVIYFINKLIYKLMNKTDCNQLTKGITEMYPLIKVCNFLLALSFITNVHVKESGYRGTGLNYYTFH